MYREAILETNKSIIPLRVSLAEQAILTRGREVFSVTEPLKKKKHRKLRCTHYVHSEPLGSAPMRHNPRQHEIHAMSEPRFSREWEALYAAAMLESDSKRMRQRIGKADDAIKARLMELPETADHPEKAELQSALKYLYRLKVSQTAG